MPSLHFVFLQGMPSKFFTEIAQGLSDHGCRTTGINFCLGDWLFWRGPNTVNFRGRRSQWPEFIENFLLANQVTDLVMVGDQRTFHKTAIEVARKHGVRVSVLDFGYLRPDWLTLEHDGKNSNSRFPKRPEEVLGLATRVPAADLRRRYSDSFWNMAVRDLLYSFSNVLVGWLFYPFYRRSDQRPHPIIYFPAIGSRLLFTRRNHRAAQLRLNAMIEGGMRYFAFPLQLEHDFQLIAYSSFSSQGEAIAKVVRSFARHAEADCHLVIKGHPWDPGLTSWKRLIARVASEAGIEGRVHYFDGGDIGKMIDGSIGMVTINSTAGIQALQQQRPVKTLGEAIYDMHGLTFQGGLDAYWTTSSSPDARLVEAFVNAVAGTIQIRGVFFSEPGRKAAAAEAIHRLRLGAVGGLLAEDGAVRWVPGQS